MMDSFKKYFRCCFPFASPGSRKVRDGEQPSAKPGDIRTTPLPEKEDGPSSPIPTPGSPTQLPLLPPDSPREADPDLQPISEEQVSTSLCTPGSLEERFLALLGDREELDAYDLKEILDSLLAEYGQFSKDACRSMVALGDNDVSGKLGRQEAIALIGCLDEWQEAYHKVDSDNKGYIFGHEIDLILELLEVKLPKKTVRALNLRYSDKDGHVNFIDLVQCLSRLAGVIAHFSNKVNDSQEKASFKMDEFMKVHMYS